MTGLNLTDAAVYEAELQRQLAAAGGNSVSMLIVDMSALKRSFFRLEGHVATVFLNRIAQLLLRICRDNDTVARVGDFTFAMTFSELGNDVMQQLAAEKILRSFRSAIDEVDAGFKGGIAIGIASFPRDADDAVGLIRCANIALEDAESRGDPYRIYEPEEHQTMNLRWSIQDDFSRAVADREFEVVYQPQVSLSTRRFVGAEALCRWQHPTHGSVSPSVFVPLAIEMGLLGEITASMLSRALQDAAVWPVDDTVRRVAINIDPSLLLNTMAWSLVKSSRAIWDGNDVHVALEITEASVMQDANNDFAKLKALREQGVELAIDDFGTGFSSLSQFQKLPAGELKIDESFIRSINEEPRSRQLVETIISLAHGFDMTVVAEGVETWAQFETLAKMGCDTAQGFYIAKPMPQADLLRWLSDESQKDVEQA